MNVAKEYSLIANGDIDQYQLIGGEKQRVTVRFAPQALPQGAIFKRCVLSFTTSKSANVFIVDLSHTATKGRYTATYAGTHDVDVNWITSSSWAQDNYPLNIRFQISATTSSTKNTISNFRQSIYYEMETSSVTAPSNLALSSNVAETSSVLSWTAGSDGDNNPVTGYCIQRRTSSTTSFDNVDWVSYVDLVNATSYDVVPFGNRGDYTQFRVKTIGSAGDDFNSDWVVLSTPLRRNTLPQAPTVVKQPVAVFQDSSLTIGWSKPQDETGTIAGYHVYAAYGSSESSIGTPSLLKTFSAQGDSMTVNVTVTADRGYFVRISVSAYDSFGVQGSKKDFNLTRRNAIPSMQSYISSSVSVYASGDITIEWRAATDVTDSIAKYQVYKRVTSNGNTGAWVLAASTTQIKYVTQLDNQQNDVVQFRVCAVDTFGVKSSFTNSVSIRISTHPQVGGRVYVNLQNADVAHPDVYENGQINLSWDAAQSQYATIAYYRYAYAISDNGVPAAGSYVESGDITGLSASLSLTLQQFPRGKYATFKVIAYDSLGTRAQGDYAVSIRRNILNTKPTLLYPASKVHGSNRLIISVDASPLGIARSLRITNGSDVQTLSNIGDSQITLYVTSHLTETSTIAIDILDSIGGVSNTETATVTFEPVSWTRSIESGSVISDTSISHRVDIKEMLTKLNESRAAYGFDSVAFSVQPGYFKDWYSNMTFLYEKIKQVYVGIGNTCDELPSAVNGYPTASVVNTVRSLIEGV